jgi:hypothetical protein
MNDEGGRCPSCGAELAPNARSCLACGHELERSAENGVAEIQQQLAAARDSQAAEPVKPPVSRPAAGATRAAGGAPGTLSVVNQVLLVVVIVALFATMLLSLPAVIRSLNDIGLVICIWLLFALPSAPGCFFLAAAKGYHANYAVLWGALGGLPALIAYAGLPDRHGRQPHSDVSRGLERGQPKSPE